MTKIDALDKLHLEIFICYARKDRQFLDGLRPHLMSLQRQGHISFWHDGDISAGKEWEKEIEKYLDKAQIVLLLVSPDFMASDYCYQKEMKRVIERYKRGEVRIIPILIRPVHWESSPIGIFQALPKGGKPVTSWHSPDEAFFDITTDIQKAAEELRLKADPQMLIRKYFEHKDAIEEIYRAGLIFCPECGSTEFTGDSMTNYTHDEIYYFSKCKNCGHFWEI